MNAVDVLKYGNVFIQSAIEGIPPSEWETGGVCGVWSVKEIVAHLASFEHMLLDVLGILLGRTPGPYLERMGKLGGQGFNDYEVEHRKGMHWEEVLSEYHETHLKTMELISQIPVESQRKPGAVPGYGEEYDLEDFIAYTYYGHKREHGAQINVFKDTLQK